MISGYSALGLRKIQRGDDAGLLKYFEQIRTAAQRATGLVTQMLSFSRSANVEQLSVQLADRLEDDLSMMRATLPSTLELVTRIDTALPSVMADKTQISQVVMNLATNARDAMDEVATLSVELCWMRDLDIVSSVSHKPEYGDWVARRVSDSGSGIPA